VEPVLQLPPSVGMGVATARVACVCSGKCADSHKGESDLQKGNTANYVKKIEQITILT
jgi:hypothetical protein